MQTISPQKSQNVKYTTPAWCWCKRLALQNTSTQVQLKTRSTYNDPGVRYAYHSFRTNKQLIRYYLDKQAIQVYIQWKRTHHTKIA